MKIEKIVLAAGCFWGVQHILDEINGVLKTRCGYIGGHLDQPTYREVSRGDTNHAEAVEVQFDRDKISLSEVLNYFWRLHDPTQLNRQGSDSGTQYRSAIFYFSEEQRKVAEESMSNFNLSGVMKNPAVTQIKPSEAFYEAEDYHQKYFEKNHGGAVCHVLREK